MQEIKELTSIISRNKIKQFEIAAFNTARKTKQSTLYHGIINGEIKTDQEAINLLYPNNPRGKAYYNKTKANLFDRLLNSLFFIDTTSPKFSDLQRAYYLCHKKFAEIKILLGRGARSLAINLAEYTIKKTLFFEFTDITIYLARVLKSHYGQIVQNQRKYLKFKAILDEQQEIYKFELLAEEYYSELILISKYKPGQIVEMAETFVINLKPVQNKIQSFRFIQFYYLIQLIKCSTQNDGRMVIILCNEIISKFKKNKKYNASNLIALYLNESLPITIKQKKFAAGESFATEALRIHSSGSTNWYITNQLLIILYFHSKKYEQAGTLFEKIVNTDGFKSLDEIFKERWRIIEAFIHYLISIEKIHGKDANIRPFRLSRFINDVPKYSKDKRGLNITIIIIQILFLLQKKQFGKIHDKVESLNIYCNRYLRRNETFRSNCFIKMLLELPAANFNANAAKRKTANLREKLASMPIENSTQESDVEFIPYEDLWKMVIESLGNKFHRTRISK